MRGRRGVRSGGVVHGLIVALVAVLVGLGPTAAGAEAPPTFTTSPTPTTVVAGQSATFTVATSGDPAPEVSWERSDDAGATWTTVAGASGETLSFTAVDADHDARFRAVATSSAGVATSDPAVLTVWTAPVVTTQPTSALVLTNTAVTLTAAASGRPTPTVQWQRSTDSGATWTDLAGATATTFSVTATTATTGYRYRAVFTNAAGTATSSVATITVGTKPSGSIVPASTTGMVGWSLDLTAAVTGTAPITVVWQTAAPGSNAYTNVAGDTSTGIHLVLDSSMNGRKYRIVSTNALGTHTSAARTITINTTGLPPVITTQPVAQLSSPIGLPASLSVATTDPTATFQWQRSPSNGPWTNIVGATQATYSIASLSAADRYFYRAVVTNPYGSTASSYGLIAPLGPPILKFQISPTSRTIAVGEATLLSVAGIVDPAAVPTWERSVDSGATWTTVAVQAAQVGGADLTVTGTTAMCNNAAVRYRVTLTNAYGSVTSDPASVFVACGPTVTTQPTGGAWTSPGSIVTYTAAAVGSPTPTVKWQVSTDGGATYTDIAGATSTTYSLTATLALSGNRYRAVFTNSQGSTPTNVVVLTVLDHFVTVISGPTDQTSPNGASVTFTATAYGTVAPTVQWQSSSPGSSTWSDIAGATARSTFTHSVSGSPLTSFPASSSAYVVPSPTVAGTRYRAVFTNAGASATTTAATVIGLVGTAPVLTTLPVLPSTLTASGNVLIATAATGNPTPTAHWGRAQFSQNQCRNFVEDVFVFGAPTSLAFSGSNTADTCVYVWYTNTIGRSVTGFVIVPRAEAPPFTEDPAPVTAAAGATVTSTCLVRIESVGLGITWERAAAGSSTWTAVPGVGSTASMRSTYTRTITAADDGARYRCRATNVYGTTFSTPATMSVVSPPTVTSAPADATVVVGDTATFSAAATGTPTPTVAWERSTDGGASWSAVPGATSPSLALPAVTLAMSGDRYRAVFTNSEGSVTSAAATLTVLMAPTVTADPVDATAAAGGDATFVAAASGAPVPTVAWERSVDGGATWAVVPGATSATLTVSTVTVAMSGDRYRAVFSNSASSVASAAATLTVVAAPVVTADPQDASVDEGSGAAFAAAASGAPAPSVAWEVSVDGGATWSTVAGATSTTLTLSSVTPSMSGNRYRAVFSNSVGAVASAAAVLSVEPGDATAPSVAGRVVSPATPTFGWYAGPVSVQVDATDDVGVVSVTWSASGATSVASTTVAGSSATVPVSAQGTTTVSYTAIDAAGNISAVGSTIVSIDARPVLSVAGEVTQLEPDDGGTRGASVQFNLDRDAPSDVVVSYYTQNGTATGCASGSCDYTTFGTVLAPRTVTIKAGVRQASVGVPIRPDAVVEADEAFSVVVLGVVGPAVVSAERSAEVTILDVDSRSSGGTPVLMVTPRQDVVEGDAGATKAQVLISLSKALTQPVTVTYWTVDGTAHAQGDYAALTPRSVSIPVGTLSKTIDVTTVGNTVADGDRWFAVAHSTANPSGVPLVDVTSDAVVTIVDDDAPAG